MTIEALFERCRRIRSLGDGEIAKACDAGDGGVKGGGARR
jgi:hypothetical protein